MADINKTINIDVTVDNQELNKAAQGVEKVTKATENHTKSLDHNKKGVLENGGAMGLLGAATGGLAMDFKDAIEAIEMTGISLKGLRGAIIATGIGALAIILLELITNWDKWIKVIDGSTAATEKLNEQIAQTAVEYEKVAIAREADLAAGEAQGVSEDELHRRRMAQFAETKDRINEQIAEKEKAIAIEKDSYWTNYELIATTEAEIEKLQIERLKSTTNANLEWQKNQFRLTQEEVDNMIKSDDEKAASSAKSAATRLANEKKYLTESIAFIKKYYDIIDATGKAIVDFSDTGFGKVYSDLTKLQSLTRDLVDSNAAIQKRMIETSRRLKDTGLTDKEFKELKRQFDELAAQETSSREKAQIGFKLAREMQMQVLEQRDAELETNQKIIDQYDELNRLKLEEYELNNKLFEYEKSADGRLDNSNQFSEIETRINEIYAKRIEIIEKTKLAERDILQGKQDSLQADVDLLMSDLELMDKKSEGRKDFNEQEKVRLKELENERKLSGQTEEAQQLEKMSKAFDIEVQMSENSVAIAQNTSDLMIEIATTTSDKELEIEANTWEERKRMRDEALDREQQYKNAVMGIASESQNFVDALISNGHLKGKKAAENALALRKVIGVANVVITGQEEIRGIWANPSLTALPDTGVVSKSLLTAAAVARAGLSIATILAQKLSGGSSNSGASGNATGPQASFNIVGSSTSNQLAATIAQQQNQPVKAYVVGTDMTTQQALDRNIQKSATFL